MRWDFDSRKLAYERSEKQFEKSQISFEQELDNLKSILAEERSGKRGLAWFKKGYLAVALTLMVLALIGIGILFVL